MMKYSTTQDKAETNMESNNKRPTVNSVLKLLEKGLYKVNAHEFLSDVFECGAIAISNKFDLKNFKVREEQYLNIMKKYTLELRLLISEVFTEIYKLLSSQIHYGFNDYLGEIYMRSETNSKQSGQFFTPFNLSRLCAGLCIDENKLEHAIENDTILTVHEPTVGSGGMVLATAELLYNKYDFNISRNLFVECGDIDRRCVHMTYLQLSLAGIPAVVFHRDGLSLKTWDRWETPAYIMQYLRFKDILKGTANDFKINYNGG